MPMALDDEGGSPLRRRDASILFLSFASGFLRFASALCVQAGGSLSDLPGRINL